MNQPPGILLRKFLCFAVAWRIVNPEAEDSPATRRRIITDAEKIGLFDNNWTSSPPIDVAIHSFQGVIAEWEELFPDQPEYRNYLQSFLDALITDIQLN
jgi:hypothetical protein